MPRNDDLTLLALANGLDALGKHAAAMAPDEWHPLCLECQTMMVLARVVVAGRHICQMERAGPNHPSRRPPVDDARRWDGE